jgi:hypothetical protein
LAAAKTRALAVVRRVLNFGESAAREHVDRLAHTALVNDVNPSRQVRAGRAAVFVEAYADRLAQVDIREVR